MVHGGWAGAIDHSYDVTLHFPAAIALSSGKVPFFRESAVYMVIYGTFEDISTISRILDLF